MCVCACWGILNLDLDTFAGKRLFNDRTQTTGTQNRDPKSIGVDSPPRFHPDIITHSDIITVTPVFSPAAERLMASAQEVLCDAFWFFWVCFSLQQKVSLCPSPKDLRDAAARLHWKAAKQLTSYLIQKTEMLRNYSMRSVTITVTLLYVLTGRTCDDSRWQTFVMKQPNLWMRL